MIDTHCHLVAKEFDGDRDEVIARAFAAGVSPLITIADSLEDVEKGITLAQKYPGKIFATAGTHPHHASKWREGDFQRLRNFAEHPHVIAIGEIGLDYHYDFSQRDVQRKVFEEQLLLAKKLSLPVVLHTREAIEDTWQIIEKVQPEKLVVHCCTERFSAVEKFLNAGYFLSFTGIATFPKSEEIRETIRKCPLEQLLIETDAPFLAPLPHRGKRNEPAFVLEVARCVAEIKSLPLEEIDQVTTENAKRFFRI